MKLMLVFIMSLSLIYSSANAEKLSQKGYFSQQALALFSDDDVDVVDVSNIKQINTSTESYELVGDLKILPKRDKREIVSSVQYRLRSDYMEPTIPNSLKDRATGEEKAFYQNMTTLNIAEQIVNNTLGNGFAVGSPILKPLSKVKVFIEGEDEYLVILGKKVKVDAK